MSKILFSVKIEEINLTMKIAVLSDIPEEYWERAVEELLVQNQT